MVGSVGGAQLELRGMTVASIHWDFPHACMCSRGKVIGWVCPAVQLAS